MTNRPRAIGTSFASSIVRYLQTVGYPHAELRALHGQHDLGDVVGIPGLVIECKGGHAAEQAGDVTIAHWMAETERERCNARADVGLLVVKRKGVGLPNAALQHAYLRLDHLDVLLGEAARDPLPPAMASMPLRMLLVDAALLLRVYGYGVPVASYSPSGFPTAHPVGLGIER